ncbi:Glutamate receptor [Rhynchospora pubera]|uniref:Glutamate receptor n=1 Tax=Rhynchospora pubera TaxID=906938 RepID=A0AAV8C3P0_9POAL|nr:Glutamate receptor [Rhynchospora pubera]
MSYPETAFVRCIADIVKSFNWRKVITVYEDDVFGSVYSSALLLSNALDAIGSELEYRVIFQPSDLLSDPRSTLREQLNNTKSQLSTVYIILRISETLAPILFEEAVSLGLMSKGYIWICGNDITTLLDSSFTPTFISKYMQGLVGIRSYIDETVPDYLNFQSTFQQRFKTEYEKSGESSFDAGVYALRAYDVVNAISLATATYEKNNKSLVENLMATNYSGLSGLVRPTNGSLDDRERYSTFHIINVVGRSYREMGIWVDGNGFHENDEEFLFSENLESVVFWPGGPHTSPSGLRKLKVGVPATNNTIWENFVSVEEIGNSTICSGFCIDVFNATLSCLGYEVQYDCVAIHNVTTYDNLVNKVHSGEVDIVVGDVTILANRSQNVSFTKPYLSSGLAMLVPVEVDRYGWLPTKTFSLALWMCILALLLYYIMLVWFHELVFYMLVEEEASDFRDGSLMEQLGASLWIVCNGIFLNLDKRIRSYHTKIVIILWFFVAQLVLNSFTASLSSILVTQNLRPDVDTMKIGCDGDSFVPNYLTSVLNYSSESIVKIYNGSDYKLAFENGTITAAYLEVPYLRVFLSQNDNYTVHGETKMLGGFGFFVYSGLVADTEQFFEQVLPKGSLLASDMSVAILTLGENGTLRQLEKKWFPVSLSNYATPDEDNNQSLGLSNYTYMFVISSCLAFLTILHRFFEAISPNTRGQVVAQENGQQQEVELIVIPRGNGVPEIEQRGANGRTTTGTQARWST